MEFNPYAPGARRTMAIGARSGDPLTLGAGVMAGALRPSGNIVRSNTEPLVGANGEFNAGNRTEVAQAISVLHRAMQTGEVAKVDAATHDNAVARAERQATLARAFADRTGDSWLALGEVVGDQIWETLGREGFARKTLLIKTLGRGETGRLRVRRKDVTSFYATANPNVIATQVRQNFVYPPEFYLLAGIIIEDKEIEQSGGDILDDKYVDGLEQILRVEDQIWLLMARRAAPLNNNSFAFSAFTPTVFSEMRTQIARWGIPCTMGVMAFDLWNDIIADAEWSSWVDPVTKHEIVLDGSLGSIMGVKLITDGFRHDTLRVLSDGEVFFLGAPQTLGGITQRKELTTKAIDRYSQFRPERGWFMEQIEGMSFVNSRAIVRGTRV